MVRLKDLLPLQSTSRPDGGLITVTSILGASANWIALAFVKEELQRNATDKGRRKGLEDGLLEDNSGEGRVVVVSFIHDAEFWKEGLRRGGIDIPQQTLKGNFTFIDGLTALFSRAYVPTAPSGAPLIITSPTSVKSISMEASLPIRSPRSEHANEQKEDFQWQYQKDKDLKIRLDLENSNDNPCKTLYDYISKAIAQLTSSASFTTANPNRNKKKPLLILEAPDILLGAAEMPSQDVWNLILDLREVCSTTLLILHADTPFLSPSIELTKEGRHLSSKHSQITRLETQLSSFLTIAIHNSYLTVSLRMLDSGVVKDVSGVVRITRGGDWEGNGAGIEDKEVLYHVGSSGVQVFERGETS